MEKETDKNINDLLAMTDYSMSKLFGEPAPKKETDKEFADRIFRQSGLAEKFDKIDLQIQNIKNTLREVLTDCHQNDRTASNSEDNIKKVVLPHPTEESTAIARFCHMCGGPGATISEKLGTFWLHPGLCYDRFVFNEEKATNDFENNFSQ